MNIPQLHITRTETGEIFVADENNHTVAMFRIMLPRCHLKGSDEEVMDAGLNLDMAKNLIDKITVAWIYREEKKRNDTSRTT